MGTVRLNNIKEVWKNFLSINQECKQMKDLHLILYKKKGGKKTRTKIGRFDGFRWKDEEHETKLLYDRLKRFKLEELCPFCDLFNIKITTRDSKEVVMMKLIAFLKYPLENPNEEKTKSQEENDKRFQECSTGSQQYNTELQTDPKAATDGNKQVESEKSAELEDLRELRSSHNLLQNKSSTATKPCDDAIEQKESAMKEVDILRSELQQEREVRERQLFLLQQVTLALNEYKETTRQTVDDAKRLLIKFSALEDTCKTREKEISILQLELASANQKLEQKRYIRDLEDAIRVKDAQLVEHEALRRKLHNTIQEIDSKKQELIELEEQLNKVQEELELLNKVQEMLELILESFDVDKLYTLYKAHLQKLRVIATFVIILLIYFFCY